VSASGGQGSKESYSAGTGVAEETTEAGERECPTQATVPKGVYGSWDDQGLPLTDSEGKELSKNQTKKVQKGLTVHRKLHEYLAWKT
jgi:hypothetical protein